MAGELRLIQTATLESELNGHAAGFRTTADAMGVLEAAEAAKEIKQLLTDSVGQGSRRIGSGFKIRRTIATDPQSMDAPEI